MLDYTTTKIENFFGSKGKKYSTNLKKKKMQVKTSLGERFKITCSTLAWQYWLEILTMTEVAQMIQRLLKIKQKKKKTVFH